MWAGKDDEDNDYYDDSEFALPKPKSTVEHVEHLKVLLALLVSLVHRVHRTADISHYCVTVCK